MRLRVLILAAAHSVAFTSFASAEIAENTGPGVIDLKNGSAVLVFPHRNHQTLYKGKCHICHTSEGFKIGTWGREVAHELCISCHTKKSHGPTTCVECHQDLVATPQ
jgi:predicted CXXCH cytochrome family protein